MAYSPISGIFIIPCLLILGGISAIAIYLVRYNRIINKQIAEGSHSVKKRMSPAAVVFMVISIVLFLIILSIFVSALISTSANTTHRENTASESVQGMVCSCKTFTDKDLTDSEYYYFADAYKEGKVPNNSFSVETKTKENFEYTLFRNENNDHSEMSPAFVLFVRYVGENDYKGFAESMEYTSYYGSGVLTGHGESSEYYCVLGNAGSSDFHYTLAMFRDYKTCENNFESNQITEDKVNELVIKNSDEVFELSITDIDLE